jgi:hypothetical protein
VVFLACGVVAYWLFLRGEGGRRAAAD